MTYFVYVDYTIGEEVLRPFYVGKGDAHRLRRKFRSKLHENICRKHGCDRRIEFSTSDEEEAYTKECELIVKYRTYVYGDTSHWGANFTLGGDGVRGQHPPLKESHRQAISRANSHPKTMETRAKMKLAAQRRASDPEWIQKMQDVAKKRWQDPVYIAKRVGMKYNKESR